jgi:chemotaxis methyl-accepting protein methylase
MAVIELADNLNKLEKYVKSFEDREYTHSREYFETRNSLVETVSQHLSILLLGTAEKMKNGFSQDTKDNLKTAFSYFREHIGRYLFQSPFTKRSFEKPRGYAGDYLMMSQIYSNNSFANSLFGSCMEAAVQSFGEPSAVRNRAQYLSGKVLAKINSDKSNLKFLSVASGPAEEVKVLLEKISQEQLDRCEFHLLDQDEEALQFAQRNILDTAMKLGKKIKLHLINRGIKEVLVGGVSEQYDAIYSSGLFDYFSDPVASKACKILYQSVKFKGSLIIGNFNTMNTNWFGM